MRHPARPHMRTRWCQSRVHDAQDYDPARIGTLRRRSRGRRRSSERYVSLRKTTSNYAFLEHRLLSLAPFPPVDGSNRAASIPSSLSPVEAAVHTRPSPTLRLRPPRDQDQTDKRSPDKTSSPQDIILQDTIPNPADSTPPSLRLRLR